MFSVEEATELEDPCRIAIACRVDVTAIETGPV
jgi:hypothetical protein